MNARVIRHPSSAALAAKHARRVQPTPVARPAAPPAKALPPERGTLPSNLDDSEVEARVLINARLRDYIRSGGRMQALALRSGISLATIQRLAYFETAHPRATTLFSVARALGIEVIFR